MSVWTFREEALVQGAARAELLRLSDGLLKGLSEGRYLSLQADERAAAFSGLDQGFYLIKNRFTIKGKQRIDNRKVYRLTGEDLSSLISAYMEHDDGDRLQWVVIPENLSTEAALYIDGSIRLLHRRGAARDLEAYRAGWISDILGGLPLTIENLAAALLGVAAGARVITDGTSAGPRLRSVVKKDSGTIIVVWRREGEVPMLMSLSFARQSERGPADHLRVTEGVEAAERRG
jgi:hypothetical protein